MKPKIFVASSVEGLSVAYAVQTNLQHTAELTVWDQGVFALSHSALESLLAVLSKSDFGIFVFTGDDLTKIRGKESATVRDNVVFELGMFIGRLGKERSFVLIPAGADLRLPTDLLGLTPGNFETGRSDGSYEAACGPVCNRIREAVKRLGFLLKGKDADIPPDTEAGESSTASPPTSGPVLSKEATEASWFDAWRVRNYNNAIELLSGEMDSEEDDDAKYDKKCIIGMLKYESDAPSGFRYFDELIKGRDVKAAAYWWMASSLSWSDLHAKALEIFEEGLKSFPGNEDLLSSKATCFRSLGKPEDSINVLKDALIIQPSSARLNEDLVQQFLDRKDIVSAREQLVKALTLLPRNESLWSKFGRLLSEDADNIGAARVFRKLTSLNHKNAGYHCLLGNAYLSLGFPGLALESYRRANELSNGKEGWIVANIGNLLSNQGLHQEAIDKFGEALKIESGSQYTHERLAVAITNRKAELDRFGGIVELAAPLLSLSAARVLEIPGLPPVSS